MIKLKDIEFSYNKKDIVLKNICISIEHKEFVGMLGHNGAGKTTLFKIIIGLLNPQKGQVFIDNSTSQKKQKVRGYIAYMPENGGIYEKLTALENLYFRARIAKLKKNIAINESERLLERLGLINRGKEQVGLWSNGMKKRLSLACALISNPKLLLLDEPTNGLDPESLKIINEMLTEINLNGTTILMNSHDLNTVQEICKKIIVLQKGEIIYENILNLEDTSLKDFYLDLTKKE